ncbi:hypothetical protein BGZ67_009839 [Mortierella alpina]|nr:hypothetical protein BGZ67_009839 [Mortierella alpina]
MLMAMSHQNPHYHSRANPKEERVQRSGDKKRESLVRRQNTLKKVMVVLYNKRVSNATSIKMVSAKTIQLRVLPIELLK